MQYKSCSFENHCIAKFLSFIALKLFVTSGGDRFSLLLLVFLLSLSTCLTAVTLSGSRSAFSFFVYSELEMPVSKAHPF